jgi:hypothetical protein
MGMACGMQVKRVHVAGDERFMVDEHRRGASRSQNLEESDRTGPSGEGRRAQKEWRWLVVLPGFFFSFAASNLFCPFASMHLTPSPPDRSGRILLRGKHLYRFRGTPAGETHAREDIHFRLLTMDKRSWHHVC